MSLPTTAALDALGVALAYPRQGYRATLAGCERELAATVPDAAQPLQAFLQAIEDLDQIELEDLYTRSFDLNPVSTLEVGWHLYGEQYRRGRFLVRTRELMEKVGIDECGELPDHLMSLLPAVGRIEIEEASVLAGLYLLPAIGKMIEGLTDQANPYQHLLAAIRLVLEPLAAEAGELPKPSIASDLIQIGAHHQRFNEKGTLS